MRTFHSTNQIVHKDDVALETAIAAARLAVANTLEENETLDMEVYPTGQNVLLVFYVNTEPQVGMGGVKTYRHVLSAADFADAEGTETEMTATIATIGANELFHSMRIRLVNPGVSDASAMSVAAAIAPLVVEDDLFEFDVKQGGFWDTQSAGYKYITVLASAFGTELGMTAITSTSGTNAVSLRLKLTGAQFSTITQYPQVEVIVTTIPMPS